LYLSQILEEFMTQKLCTQKNNMHTQKSKNSKKKPSQRVFTVSKNIIKFSRRRQYKKIFLLI